MATVNTKACAGSRVHHIDSPVSARDENGNYRAMSNKETMELASTLNLLELQFPYARVRNSNDLNPSGFTISAGLLLTDQPLEDIHPALNRNGRIRGSPRRKDPFAQVVFDETEAIGMICDYFAPSSSISRISVFSDASTIQIFFSDEVPNLKDLPAWLFGLCAIYGKDNWESTHKFEEEDMEFCTGGTGLRELSRRGSGERQVADDAGPSQERLLMGDKVVFRNFSCPAIRHADGRLRVITSLHACLQPDDDIAKDSDGIIIGRVVERWAELDIACIELQPNVEFDESVCGGILKAPDSIRANLEIKHMDFVSCASWAGGPFVFEVRSNSFVIEHSTKHSLRKIRRLLGIYSNSDLTALADSLCGAALIEDQGSQLYGLFCFVDKEDPHTAYFHPIGDLVAEGWQLEYAGR